MNVCIVHSASDDGEKSICSSHLVSTANEKLHVNNESEDIAKVGVNLLALFQMTLSSEKLAYYLFQQGSVDLHHT